MLALEAVRRVVADAIRKGGRIDVGSAVSTIGHTYPTSGMTIVEIEREIAEAARAAGIAMTGWGVGRSLG